MPTAILMSGPYPIDNVSGILKPDAPNYDIGVSVFIYVT
jgi:hypothetical protein